MEVRSMVRGGMFYEISFFIYLVFVFVSKWVNDPLVRKINLIVLGLTFLYQLIYLFFRRKKDCIGFGRCLAIGGFYASLVVFLMFVIYSIALMLKGARFASLFSLQGFYDFYSLHLVSKFSFGGLAVIIACLLYMFIYIVVTNRSDVRKAY